MTDGGMRYVHASRADTRGATISSWGIELRGNQTREAFLARVKLLLPPAGRVIVVLDPADYQILQIESPGVPIEELQGAMRWRAMEYVDGSPDDYTIDLLPLDAEPGRPADVITTIASNNIVRSKMLDCQTLKRPCTVIDVAETCQRNLLHALLLAETEDPPIAAALVASAGRALIVVSVRGQLYFFRRFEFDVDTLAVAADEDQEPLIGSSAGEESATRSMVQLHRSLDMWDLSYPNYPLATLRVDCGPKTPAVIDRLAPETGVDTRPLTLSTIFKLPSIKSSPPWQDPAFLPLLGALLRPSEANA
jgi:MSHA biogenesis protein MshI